MKLVFTLLLLFSVSAHAANVYIRSGQSGDGSAWDNALGALPSSLTRGNTYYLGDGTYAGYTFDDNESSTDLITVKKATSADHGTETGWSSTYGDGQAVFTGGLLFATDYYTIDGATRDESNWDDDTAYGIKAPNVYIQNSNLPPGADNITWQYLALVDGGGEAVYLGGFSSTIDDIIVRRCLLKNWSNIQAAVVDGFTVEYTYFDTGYAKEAIRGQSMCKNAIIRWSVFKDSSQFNPGDPTSGCTAPIAIWDGGANDFDNVEIYGNVFFYTIEEFCNGGVIVVGGDGGSWEGSPANNCKIYNNTIVGMQDSSNSNILINGGTGNEASNNLWYDCFGTPSATPNTASNGEEASDPFVNSAGFDWHLTEHIAGTSLSSPYNVDMDGVTRGYNGTFDRGAFQFVTTPTSPSGTAYGVTARVGTVRAP